MELTKENFDDKALQVQGEITQQLTMLCSKRGNNNLPVELVNDVFHKAISHYMCWAYNEGLEVNKPKNNKIINIFSKIKK